MPTSIFINLAGGGIPSNPTFDVVTITGKLLIPNGTAAEPSLALVSDTSAGIYSPGSGSLGFVKSTAILFRTSGDGLTITNGQLAFANGLGSADTFITRTGSGALQASGSFDASSYKSGTTNGVDFGPGAPTSITVKKGIVTAAS